MTTLSGLRQILATGSPLKNMKNSFYFILKALFVLKIIKFLSLPFSHAVNDLIRNFRLISKFITSHLGKHTMTIHILPNISRSKGNQTKKFGYLIEYNMGKMFPEKSYSKCGGKTIPRSFSKK